MRIPRIYTPQSISLFATLQLEEQASQHLNRVLRMGEGALIELFDGSGEAYLASIATVSKKTLGVSIREKLPHVAASPLITEIAIAVSKGDKMDLIVQKATELGVNTISPVISTRTDVKMDADRWQKKLEHWQQVMISACEQSGRNHLANISPVRPLTEWLAQSNASLKLICHPSQAKTFKEFSNVQNLAMCFGSEGGFTDDEVKLAEKAGFHAVSMGPRILRAETAPIAALGIAQLQWGDF